MTILFSGSIYSGYKGTCIIKRRIGRELMATSFQGWTWYKLKEFRWAFKVELMHSLKKISID